MSIDEIEIPGSSISFNCWNIQAPSIPELFDAISKDGERFSLDPESSGFHDVESSDSLIRGFYSIVTPFEVEHLTEGMTVKTLLKRVESCEFFLASAYVFMTGKAGPQKILSRALTALSNSGVVPLEIDFHMMSQFQDRLSMLKSIALTNPKEKDIRRARLSGRIESYTEYNIIDPRNHGIDSVGGLADTPLGPMTITVGHKGNLRLNVRKGFILTIDCLQWIVCLIREEKPPEAPQKPGTSFALPLSGKGEDQEFEDSDDETPPFD